MEGGTLSMEGFLERGVLKNTLKIVLLIGIQAFADERTGQHEEARIMIMTQEEGE